MTGSTSALVAPGAMIAGKYKLHAVIGEGGMGSVWSATHLGLGQPIAIKFVSKEFVSSVDALRRFDAEAKAAAQLRSRHVVQVFDNGTLEDGTPYIAMELLNGETMSARVQRGGPVPLSEAVNIMTQCCKALGRAHAAGIVHRDIKPDNIFLAQSHDDDSYVVKILDFGIAKFAAGPKDHAATRTGTVLGTPLYMSPEQARGLRTIDHRTDLYSLGLVAYTALTGKLAFSGESFGDLLLQICTSPLPSICANASWLPSTMEPWFQRACAREPQGRYASAQEFADSLRVAAQTTAPVQGGSIPDVPGQVLTAAGGLGHPLATSGSPSGMSRSDVGLPPGKRTMVLGIGGAIVLVAGGIVTAALMMGTRANAPLAAASATVLPSSESKTTPAAQATTVALPSDEPPPADSPLLPAADASAARSPSPAHAPQPAAPPAPPRARTTSTATPSGTIDLGY